MEHLNASFFLNFIKYMIFQRRQKALLWRKRLKEAFAHIEKMYHNLINWLIYLSGIDVIKRLANFIFFFWF